MTPWMESWIHLISWGTGSVLSRPRATNPRVLTYNREWPRIKNAMAWQILEEELLIKLVE